MWCESVQLTQYTVYFQSLVLIGPDLRWLRANEVGVRLCLPPLRTLGLGIFDHHSVRCKRTMSLSHWSATVPLQALGLCCRFFNNSRKLNDPNSWSSLTPPAFSLSLQHIYGPYKHIRGPWIGVTTAPAGSGRTPMAALTLNRERMRDPMVTLPLARFDVPTAANPFPSP